MEKVIEMIPVQETKEKKKNKGFSLVELIIVIAIMAILVGVVGTQVLPYIEKAREAKDLQVMSSICTAAQTAFSQNASSLTTGTDYNVVDFQNHATLATTTAPDVVVTTLSELTGYSSTANVISHMSSKKGKTIDKITISYSASTGAITVTPLDTDSTPVDVTSFIVKTSN